MRGGIWALLTPYGQNYLHLSKSMGLGNVHIVSIDCVTLVLVVDDVGAYIQI